MKWPTFPGEATDDEIDKRLKQILALSRLFAEAKEVPAQLAIFEDIKKDLPVDDRETFARDLGSALESLSTNSFCMRVALFEVFGISEEQGP